MTVRIRRVREPFGYLGNMSGHALIADGRAWLTAEALFQARRFADEEIRERIREAPSGMAAKRVAAAHAAHRVVVPWSAADVRLMRGVLVLKVEQHPSVRDGLASIPLGELIVEDVTRRPSGSGEFWGARLAPGADPDVSASWTGTNTLGRLWMAVRWEMA